MAKYTKPKPYHFETSITVDGVEEVDVRVEYTYYAGCPDTYEQPGDPAEVEVTGVYLCDTKKDILSTLSDEVVNDLTDQAMDSFDPSDEYDFEPDDFFCPDPIDFKD